MNLDFLKKVITRYVIIVDVHGASWDMHSHSV